MAEEPDLAASLRTGCEWIAEALGDIAQALEGGLRFSGSLHDISQSLQRLAAAQERKARALERQAGALERLAEGMAEKRRER